MHKGISLNPTSKTVMYGDTYGALATTIKVGHTLGGWTTEPEGKGSLVDADSIVSLTSNHTLYAKWIPNTQTITFDSQGGSDSDPQTKTVTYGQPYGELPNVTLDGHTFGGWWTGEEGTGTQITEATVFTYTIDRTLYAKWIFDVFTGPGGGLVFYENPNWETDGWRYLEAAPFGWYDGETDSDGIRTWRKDDDPRFQWGAEGYDYIIFPSTETGIGTGASNTANIVNYHDTLWTWNPDKGDFYANPREYHSDNDGTVAAKVCADYRGGGYDDWFLPSRDELNMMYKNLWKNNLGGFSWNWYWSSSSGRNSGYNNAEWFISFHDGSSASTLPSTSWISIRPIRAFM